MDKSLERLYNGVFKENPTFVLMLGMCPTLAVTTSVVNAIGMGLSTTAVLMFSNLIISAMRNIIPDRVRIPAFIVIVASLVTVVQLLMQGYTSELYKSLGIYIPLIVVNCIILGRAESYASKNPAIPSFFDGLGMGFGFTISLSCIGFVRELIGGGTFLKGILPAADFPNGIVIIPDGYRISIFVLAPGAFFVLALLSALQNHFKAPSATNTGNTSEMACGGNCAACFGEAKLENHITIDKDIEKKELEAKKKKEEALAKAKAAKENANAGEGK